jgi:membrane-associated protease RseP (regulator of RpoE activity)
LLNNPLQLANSAKVERPMKYGDKNSPKEVVEVEFRPRLSLQRSDSSVAPPHLLGLSPLMRFSFVQAGGRADLAGVQVGDTILDWNGIKFPTHRQILLNINESTELDPDTPERDLPVKVIRARTGKVESLVIRPKVKIVPITGKRLKPTIQAEFGLFADDLMLVGAVVEKVFDQPTPVHTAGIPVGAMITAVNDEPVKNWIAMAETFIAHAGQDVTLTYNFEGQSGLTRVLRVPRTVRTELGLGAGSDIVAIDGKEKVELEINGRTVDVAVTHGLGLNAALKDAVGKTIEVTYRENPLSEIKKAQVAVTEEMTYPWVWTMNYTIDLAPVAETTRLKKDNPIAALRVGAKKTYYFVVQVYQVMERMIFSRSLGVENISGPIGIVKMGNQMAQEGYIQLLYFLAIISANLAVINFLPLPIVDGGLMVFLIIEKIKGSPISVRLQVATQVVGLVLIVSVFLFVTLQDLMR